MTEVRAKIKVSMLAVLVAALFGPIVVSSPAQAADCSLGTAVGASGTPGSAENPWLVKDDADFQIIGEGGCSLSGHYRQTADIRLTNATPDKVRDGFSGSYDGDFYTLTLAGTWSDGSVRVLGVFGSNISGTVKKLHLAGDYKPSNEEVGSPLAFIIGSGGVVSQVRSTVNVTVIKNSGSIKLSGLVSRLDQGALMEYSSATGVLSWDPTVPPSLPSSPGPYQYYAGLVTDVGGGSGGSGTRSVEIRDSYSRVTVKWPSDARCKAYFGGIIGNTGTVASDVYLVRTYSASQIDPTTNTSSDGCSSPPAIGGLFGRSDSSRRLADPHDSPPTYVYSVSSFWAKDLIGNVSNSIGSPAAGSTDQYDVSSLLPRAVGLTSDYLKSISTYQSKGTAPTGIPNVSANLAVGSSTGAYTTNGTLNTNEQTYRWAIESGSVRAFVPPTYPTPQPTPPTTAFFNRTVFNPLQSGATMLGRGGTLETTTDTIPALGRVWEICAESNGGFPVLVWEEENCGGNEVSGGGDGSGDGNGGGKGSGHGNGGGEGASGSASNQPELAATGTSPTAAVLVTLMATAMTALGLLVYRRSRKLMVGR